MANEKNLKPFTSEQSREKAVRNGKKGGIASGIAKREKKTFNDLAKTILSLSTTDETMVELARSMGIESPDNKQMVVIGLTLSAIKGNHNAFDRLLELTDEKEWTTDEQTKQADLLSAIQKAVQNDN